MDGANMEKRGRPRKNTTKDDENNPNVLEQISASGDGAHEGEQISLAKILNEIKDFRQDSHKQLQDIKEELNKSNKRIEEAENRIDEAETRIQNTEEVLEEMLQLTEQIEARLNDQEGRARRSNIRIYGVPEKAEENSSDMISFLEDFLKSTLDLNPPVDLQIERAHRALAPNPPTAAKPRSIIAKFLNYRTKELVIKTAWERKVIEWKGNRIFFDHDYAPDVLWKRRKYQEAKRILKEHDIKFQTRFPARLKVFYSEGTVLYNSAEEATTDMEKRGLPVTVHSTPSSLRERVQQLTWRETGKKRGAPARTHPSYKDKLLAFRR